MMNSRTPVGLSLVWLAIGALTAAGCVSGTTASIPVAFPHAANASLRAAVEREAALRATIVQHALELRGVPYQLGGDEPAGGLDCSGLVRFVFGEQQVEVPRTAAEQFTVGRRIDLGDIRPGDLIFFSTVAPGASHVGIALDASTFLHAPGDGKFVRTERFNTPYWMQRFLGVRQVVGVVPAVGVTASR
jgi:cell wall-associated NlpC family hydrolase